ncbi:threonyl-tRNA synthetase [Zygosaccharomyces mellis]|uniref:threonine--tRNA ligase n=1 Tax=Zygosaccharomyces mellis TaxID=42258 RepID=A0A4C2E3E5_9SACH|nr:threonyl-tRNA synthetase [Zygosaccharomyces mellis]
MISRVCIFKKIPIRPARTYSKITNKTSNSSADISHEVSNKQKLFLTDPVSPGSIFFLPNGTKILNKLIQFMKLQQQFKYGFKEVVTPLIYRKSLWEQSGHWENYKEDMFRVEGHDTSKEEYGLKPMNCPGHCTVFKRFDRSYNELPLRLSDFSPLHRNEASGALSGLTRVRKFHQDDGHIFCTPDQVESEISKCLKLVDMCYTKVFPLSQESANGAYTLELSTRPDHFIGDIKVWNYAETVLKNILNNFGKPWELNEADGAFYGPKIDIKIADQTGKYHQVATIQLDFQLPERFDLKYKDSDNTYKRPIMIHRAVFGSVERFMAILIDSNKGKWPFWLNPRQAMIIPVNTKRQGQVDTCRNLIVKLRGQGNEDSSNPIPLNSFHFNVDLDERPEPVGYRIKDALMKNYSYLIIIGDKEVETGRYAIRTKEERRLEHLTDNEIFEKFCELEKQYK